MADHHTQHLDHLNQGEATITDNPHPPATKVTITAAGIQVVIEAAGTLAEVADRAQQLHREAHERCVRPLPEGHGGML